LLELVAARQIAEQSAFRAQPQVAVFRFRDGMDVVGAALAWCLLAHQDVRERRAARVDADQATLVRADPQQSRTIDVQAVDDGIGYAALERIRRHALRGAG